MFGVQGRILRDDSTVNQILVYDTLERKEIQTNDRTFLLWLAKLSLPTDYEHHKYTIKICYNQYYSKCILNHTQLSSAKTSRKEKEKNPHNVCCVNYLCTTKQHKEWINVLTRLLMDLLVLASLIATRTILTIVHASNDSELDARMLVDKSQLLILSLTLFCLLLSLYCC